MSRILPIELKEFNATTLNGADQNFGTALLNPATKICVINTSNVDVYMDADNTPVPLHMRIPAGACITLDESTLYFRGTDQEYYLPKGTQLTLTQVTIAGTSGNIIAHIITRSIQ